MTRTHTTARLNTSRSHTLVRGPTTAGWVATPPPHARSPLSWMSTRLERLRPDDYADRTFESQRHLDAMLWISVVTGISLLIALLITTLGRQWLPSLCILVVCVQPLVSCWLVRRGRGTASSIWLVTTMVMTLDFFLFTTGGLASPVAHWYVMLPCFAAVQLPARARVPALAGIVLHQLVVAWLLRAGHSSDVLHSDVTLPSNFLLSILFAIGFGLVVSVARRAMVDRLQHAENNVRLAMNHVMSGFFVIGRDGRLVVDMSEPFQQWLRGGREGDDLHAQLLPIDAELAERYRTGLDALKSGAPVNEGLALMPPALTAQGRDFQIQYHVWYEAGESEWSKLVGTVEDVTRRRRREAAALEREALAMIVRGLQRDADATRKQVASCDELVALLSDDLDSPQWVSAWNQLRAQLERKNLAGFVQLLDEAYDGTPGTSRRVASRRVEAAWSQVQRVFNSLDDGDELTRIGASRQHYEELLTLLAEGGDRAQIAEKIELWTSASANKAARRSSAPSDSLPPQAA
ncbi:MAG: hypothetical protein ACI81R_003394 [Bradymonadia bacterium]|jgi:hypothetical protein